MSFSALAEDIKVIHLIASSSAYDEGSIKDIIDVLKEKGYSANTKYLNQQVSDFGYVNLDRERGKNLVKALTDDQVKYLWFVQGGSGALNLFPYLSDNLEKIKKSKKKIIIGFSDVTAIHYFLNKNVGWKSIHGILAAFNADIYKKKEEDGKEQLSMNNGFDQVFDIIKKGVSYNGLIPLNSYAKSGVSGSLGGGNLTLIQSLFSTSYEKYFPNEILLMEDTGSTYRQLDRTLHQITYKKDFKPKAIVFGQFYTLSASDEKRLMFKTVIKDFASRSTIPIYYYPYFGHGKTNNPFILEQKTSIKCEKDEDYCQLIQAGM
ncbi:LD-carboxypeptidase [Liberibacter crescens]|nr:LD-carboxypeptidase [Liberibacter crescens]